MTDYDQDIDKAYDLGFNNGRRSAFAGLRVLINSDLRQSRTLFKDQAGLQKALLIIDRMERDLK